MKLSSVKQWILKVAVAIYISSVQINSVVFAQPAGFEQPSRSEPPPAGGLPSGTNFREEGTLYEYIVQILNVILGLSGIILVIVLLYGGFKYLSAGGSENEVENAQNIITNAIIGIILVGLTWSIANFVLAFAFGPAIEG